MQRDMRLVANGARVEKVMRECSADKAAGGASSRRPLQPIVDRMEGLAVELAADLREDFRHLRAQDGQDTDDDDGDQHQDQGVLDETLAFLTSEKIPKHCDVHPVDVHVVEQLRVVYVRAIMKQE